MKIKLYVFVFISLILISSNFTFSQLKPFGLENKVVNAIAQFNGLLFAATDSGVYKREPGDTAWVFMGLANKNVNTIYPHTSGPFGQLVLSAGIIPTFTPGDSALIYCSCEINADGTWAIADSGINRNEIRAIESMDGFQSPEVCGETYAVGYGKLYERGLSSWYKKSFGDGLNSVRVVKTNHKLFGNVFIGGSTGAQTPFFAKSNNLDTTWTISNIFFGDDNEFLSIESDLTDTSIVYGGLERMVIKSTDGGQNWNMTSLVNTPYTFNSLIYNNDNILYAGGSTINNEFGLYWSTDKGDTWNQVSTGSDTIKGIASMAPSNNICEGNCPEPLYIATKGSGVYVFDTPVKVTDDGPQLISSFLLNQNYPNPFNPQTSIDYEVPVTSIIQIEVFDILGNKISTLVNGEKTPGRYTVNFDANNLSSGIYFYRLKSGLYEKTMKMILLR